MHYGSQADVSVLNSVLSRNGYFDIIIDDGGHRIEQQTTSFNHLLPRVQSGGIYVIEDLHSSYMEFYGGGFQKNFTTIELIKRLVDDLQLISSRNSTSLADRIFSFEISLDICFFSIK